MEYRPEDGNDWTELREVRTDPSGYGERLTKVGLKPATYGLRRTFAGGMSGTNCLLSSSANSNLTVQKGLVRPRFEGPSSVVTLESNLLRFRLTDDDGNPIPKFSVRVYLGKEFLTLTVADTDVSFKVAAKFDMSKIGSRFLEIQVEGGEAALRNRWRFE